MHQEAVIKRLREEFGLKQNKAIELVEKYKEDPRVLIHSTIRIITAKIVKLEYGNVGNITGVTTYL